jgi:hypothetical protein
MTHQITSGTSTTLADHKKAYPVTHSVWEQTMNLQFENEQVYKACQEMYETVGAYEHGEADLPKGVTLRQYAKVVVDLIVTLHSINT